MTHRVNRNHRRMHETIYVVEADRTDTRRRMQTSGEGGKPALPERTWSLESG
jgi:hypothetical protein